MNKQEQIKMIETICLNHYLVINKFLRCYYSTDEQEHLDDLDIVSWDIVEELRMTLEKCDKNTDTELLEHSIKVWLKISDYVNEKLSLSI